MRGTEFPPVPPGGSPLLTATPVIIQALFSAAHWYSPPSTKEDGLLSGVRICYYTKGVCEGMAKNSHMLSHLLGLVFGRPNQSEPTRLSPDESLIAASPPPPPCLSLPMPSPLGGNKIKTLFFSHLCNYLNKIKTSDFIQILPTL